MRRRDFITVAGSVLAAWPTSLLGQAQTQKRVALFWGFAADDPQGLARFAVFREALEKLGWVEGKNISFERVPAIGKLDRLPELAAGIVAANVDVIVVTTAGLADVVHSVTTTVPIVVGSAGDLEGTGLIASISKPGGNVTGSQILSPSLMSKRLDLLKQLVPNLTRLGIVLPITPAGIITARYIEVINETARATGIEVYRHEVRIPEEFQTAYDTMRQEGCQAALIISNPLSIGYRSQVVRAATIPTMYETDSFVRDGGLISYGPTIPPLYRDAAGYVDKVLRGASPADLPVNQPTRFALAINMKAVSALGLVVSPTMLALADEVVE